MGPAGRHKLRTKKAETNLRRCCYTYLSSRDDDIFHSVLNLHGSVWVPHGQIARVKISAVERARSRFGVLEVTMHDDVTTHGNLADRVAIAGDIYELFAGGACGTDDAQGERGGKGMPLSSDKLGALGGGERIPRRLFVVAREGSISLAVVRRSV